MFRCVATDPIGTALVKRGNHVSGVEGRMNDGGGNSLPHWVGIKAHYSVERGGKCESVRDYDGIVGYQKSEQLSNT
jgi:hypothetical protein